MALLQIQEPHKEIINNAEKQVVVGIDLGTTNSLIGIVEDGKVRLFADESGNELHKSVVAFDVAGGVVAVGNSAVAAKNTLRISSIKRLMGKGLSDLKNSAEKFDFQFDKSAANLDSVRLIVSEQQYSPEEISAEILKYLKGLAQKTLGKKLHESFESKASVAVDKKIQQYRNTEIQKAVITVPAYFDEAAKNATKLAAQLAGLEVLRLVNEPTAAALAYGLDNSSEGIYAVYDLGGGTFDISILKMQQGVFKVLGVSGDNALGGDDFDELLAHQIQKKAAIDFKKAKIFARKIKEKLSVENAVNLDKSAFNADVKNLFSQPNLSDSKDANSSSGGNFKFSISRQEFEEIIDNKINKTILLTTKLIDDINLETLDIKGIIMVGGSSRIPLIHQKLAAIFGAKKILTNLDPDRVVAIGAAWQAFNLSGANNNLLLDVIPLSLGIEMMGGIIDKVILRNTTIPASVSKEFTTYADNQNGMKLHIVQGEREFAKDCRSLAHFEIKNIPVMKAGMTRIAVTFKVDADGLLTVSAEEKITGQRQEIAVKPSYGINESEVKTMLLDSMKNAASDIKNRLLAETISESKQSALILHDDLKTFGEFITADEKIAITKKLSTLEDLLKNPQDRDLIVATEKELEKLAENLVLQKVNQSLKMFVGKKA